MPASCVRLGKTVPVGFCVDQRAAWIVVEVLNLANVPAASKVHDAGIMPACDVDLDTGFII